MPGTAPSPAAPSSSRGFGRAMAQALKVVKAAMTHDASHLLFNRPFNVEHLPGVKYHQICPRPMDLGTICARLEAQERAGWQCGPPYYSGPHEVLTDVNQVWFNCYRFNRTSEHGQAAYIDKCDSVRSLFEKKWKEAGLDLTAPFTYEDGAQPLPATRGAGPGPAAPPPAALRDSGDCPAGARLPDRLRAVLADAAFCRAVDEAKSGPATDEVLISHGGFDVQAGSMQLPARLLLHATVVRHTAKRGFFMLPVECCTQRGGACLLRGVVVQPARDSKCLVPAGAREMSLDPVSVECGPILDYVFEHGEEPRLWVVTTDAWYHVVSWDATYAPVAAVSQQRLDISSRAARVARTSPELPYEDAKRAILDAADVPLAAPGCVGDGGAVYPESAIDEDDEMLRVYKHVKAVEIATRQVAARRSQHEDVEDDASDASHEESVARKGKGRKGRKGKAPESALLAGVRRELRARGISLDARIVESYEEEQGPVRPFEEEAREALQRGKPPVPHRTFKAPLELQGEILMIWEFTQAYGDLLRLPPLPLWRLEAALCPGSCFHLPSREPGGTETTRLFDGDMDVDEEKPVFGDEAAGRVLQRAPGEKLLSKLADCGLAVDGTCDDGRDPDAEARGSPQLLHGDWGHDDQATAAVLRDVHVGLLRAIKWTASDLGRSAGMRPDEFTTAPADVPAANVQDEMDWLAAVSKAACAAPDGVLDDVAAGAAMQLQVQDYVTLTPNQRVALLRVLIECALASESFRKSVHDRVEDSGGQSKRGPKKKPPGNVAPLGWEVPPATSWQHNPAVVEWLRWARNTPAANGRPLGRDFFGRRYYALGHAAGLGRIFVENPNSASWGWYGVDQVPDLLAWLSQGDIGCERSVIAALSDLVASSKKQGVLIDVAAKTADGGQVADCLVRFSGGAAQPDGYQHIFAPLLRGMWEADQCNLHVMPETFLKNSLRALLAVLPIWEQQPELLEDAIVAARGVAGAGAAEHFRATLARLERVLRGAGLLDEEWAGTWREAWQQHLEQEHDVRAVVRAVALLQQHVVHLESSIRRDVFQALKAAENCSLYVPNEGEDVVLLRSGLLLHLCKYQDNLPMVHHLLRRALSMGPSKRFKVEFVAFHLGAASGNSRWRPNMGQDGLARANAGPLASLGRGFYGYPCAWVLLSAPDAPPWAVPIHIDSVLTDFLVKEQQYVAGRNETWRPGDRFKMFFGDRASGAGRWYTGAVRRIALSQSRAANQLEGHPLLSGSHKQPGAQVPLHSPTGVGAGTDASGEGADDDADAAIERDRKRNRRAVGFVEIPMDEAGKEIPADYAEQPPPVPSVVETVVLATSSKKEIFDPDAGLLPAPCVLQPQTYWNPEDYLPGALAGRAGVAAVADRVAALRSMLVLPGGKGFGTTATARAVDSSQDIESSLPTLCFAPWGGKTGAVKRFTDHGDTGLDPSITPLVVPCVPVAPLRGEATKAPRAFSVPLLSVSPRQAEQSDVVPCVAFSEVAQPLFKENEHVPMEAREHGKPVLATIIHDPGNIVETGVMSEPTRRLSQIAPRPTAGACGAGHLGLFHDFSVGRVPDASLMCCSVDSSEALRRYGYDEWECLDVRWDTEDKEQQREREKEKVATLELMVSPWEVERDHSVRKMDPKQLERQRMMEERMSRQRTREAAAVAREAAAAAERDKTMVDRLREELQEKGLELPEWALDQDTTGRPRRRAAVGVAAASKLLALEGGGMSDDEDGEDRRNRDEDDFAPDLDELDDEDKLDQARSARDSERRKKQRRAKELAMQQERALSPSNVAALASQTGRRAAAVAASQRLAVSMGLPLHFAQQEAAADPPDAVADIAQRHPKLAHYNGVFREVLQVGDDADIGRRLRDMREHLVGVVVWRFWEDYADWYLAVIADYRPETEEHRLIYDIGTAEETEEWANLATFRCPDELRTSLQGTGVAKEAPSNIKVLPLAAADPGDAVAALGQMGGPAPWLQAAMMAGQLGLLPKPGPGPGLG
ncbi:unnamed protein product [Pedinophyceae sp. YPF-701]|nr:unnamed protein product [Pedinophyceae sp. YPF-701]